MTTSTAPKPKPRDWYTPDTPEARAALAAGYRHLADLIEAGQAPIPTGTAVDLFAFADDDRNAPAVARDLMRALGGGRYAKDSSGSNLILRGMCGGLPINVWVSRGEVCQRVVVGTATVEVPAQPAVKAHTETREIVEWHCGSVLDAASETADAIEVEL